MSAPLVSVTATISVSPLSSPSLSSQTASFTSISLWRPCGARGVFGGQVIAQALSAALHTAPPNLGLHSTHCYFLLPADAAKPITYQVEVLRDGRSYAARYVRAKQEGRIVFVLMASYTVPFVGGQKGEVTPFGFIPTSPTGKSARKTVRTVDLPPPSGVTSTIERLGGSTVSHSLRFAVEPTGRSNSSSGSRGKRGPDAASKLQEEGNTIPAYQERWQVSLPEDVLPYGQCEDEVDRWTRFLAGQEEGYGARKRNAVEEYIQERKESPIAISVAKKRGKVGWKRERRVLWLKARLGEGEGPTEEAIKAIIAYMTDFQFIGTAARAVGLTRTSAPRLGMLASLDHSIHFYPLPEGFDPSAPLLHLMESPLADVRAGRGVMRGQLFTEDGYLLAVTSQEGVVRADTSGMEEKGLIEGGGMEGEGRDGRVRAKL